MHFHNDEKWGFHRQHDSTSHFKDELAEVFIMARQCPTLCERSGGWGQKQLTLLVPLGTLWDGGSSQPAELSCLPTTDWEQVNTIFWVNGASHAALLPHRENQTTVPLDTKRLSSSLPPGSPELVLSQPLAKMPKRCHLYPKEWQSRSKVQLISCIRAWFTRGWISGLRGIC